MIRTTNEKSEREREIFPLAIENELRNERGWSLKWECSRHEIGKCDKGNRVERITRGKKRLLILPSFSTFLWTSSGIYINYIRVQRNHNCLILARELKIEWEKKGEKEQDETMQHMYPMICIACDKYCYRNEKPLECSVK